MEPAAVTPVTAESSLTKSLVAFPSGLGSFLKSYSFGIDTKVDKYSSLVNKVRVQENIVSCLLTSKTNIESKDRVSIQIRESDYSDLLKISFCFSFFSAAIEIMSFIGLLVSCIGDANKPRGRLD